jgi:hypothetical protein
MVGEAVSMPAGEVMPMMVGHAASLSMASDAVSMSISMAGDAVSMSMAGDMVSMSMSMTGDAVSMSMAGDVVSMSMTDNAESTAVAGDEPSTLVDVDELVEAVDTGRSVMVGERASESVDPDPVVPTIGAN